MSIILKTTNLCKSFNGQTAVNNISLNIERNSVYGLLGPNGAGKSTTLKMITGILRPTSGSIEFDGHAWKRSDLNHIGALIEMPPLYENLTAYENLKVRTTILGLTDKRIDEVLQIVRLTETGKKRAGQFSLGMKQRLGIALAMVGNPDFLVLDEPINGLDPQGIVEVRDMLAGLAKERNITILISSHILEELSKVCTDFGIIHKGNLLQELSQEQLMQQCSKRIELVLDEPKKAVVTLDEIGVHDYEVIDKSHIYIYERLEESAYINERLVNSGVCPREIKVNQEELESYFLNMTAD